MQSNDMIFTTLMNPIVMFGPNQPPFIPQLPNCPQYLQPYLGQIAAALANGIGQFVQANPHVGRIYTYNLLTNNGFNNNEFASAVATAVDYIALHIHKGVYQNVNVAIQDAIPRVLVLITSANIANTPQMHYMLDAQITNEAQRVASTELMQIQHEVSHMKSATAGPMGVAMGTGYPQPQMAQMPQMGMRPGMMPMQPQQFGGGMRAQSQYMPRSNPNFTGGGFGANQPVQTMHPSSGSTASSNRFRQMPQQKPQVVEEITYEEPKELKWYPSKTQMYMLAYRPSVEYPELIEHFDPITGVNQVIMLIRAKDEIVDRQQHTLKFNSGTVPAGYSSRSRAFEEKIVEHGTELETVTVHPKDKEIGKKIAMANGEDRPWRFATNLKSAILNAQFLQMCINHGVTACTSHTEFVMLGDVTITNGDQRPELIEFRNAKTIYELCQIMRKDLQIDTPFGQNLLKYVTNEFNRFIANNVGVTGLRIDNFLDDAEEALQIIREKRGPFYADAIERMEDGFIARIFLDIDDDSYESLLAETLDNVKCDDEQIKRSDWATAVVQLVSITVCDIHSEELDMVTPTPGQVALLDSERFPALTKFGRSILKLQQNASEQDAAFAHHYMVTSDNHVYEIIRGVYDTVLITEVIQ